MASPVDRRTFLSQAALGVAATSLASGACRRAPAGADPVPDPRPAPNRAAGDQPSVASWADIRDLFPLSRDYVHLAGLLLASHPTPVRAAIETHRRHLDENPVLYLHEKRRALERATRAQAGRYMGVSGERLAFTDSTTMSLGIMYGGLRLQPGDHVLATAHDHYSTIESVRLSTAQSGATMEQIALYRDPVRVSQEEILAAIAGAIRTETRVVAVTWVHSMNGVKLPIAAIAARLAEINRTRDRPVLLFVDGVHGFGVEDVAISKLGCDAFMAGCHKWLFGPRGTGVIWASERGWDAVEATVPAFSRPNYRAWMQGRAPLDSPKPMQMSPGGFHSFEHRWALGEAFALHLRIGKKRIAERTHALASQLKQGLTGMAHVRLHTPMSPALSSGIVCFEVDGMTPDAVNEALLKERVIGSTTPYRNTYARLTPGLLNTPGEIDRAIAAVRGLAGARG